VSHSQRWSEEDGEAASRLRLNHAPLTGTFSNLVEPRFQAKHGYGEALKYRQQTRSYIAD
jgi:hypothetical protein